MMTQPNKLAVQYLLNDEPSGGSSERCQPRNRYREPGRHGQLVTVTDCHPSAGSIAYEETQVMLKYGSRNCSGTLRKHEKYVTEFPKGDFNIERYNDLVHQSCRPSISTSASAPTQSPAQDRASVRSSSMSGCGQLRLSVPSLPKAAVKRAASTQFQQFRPNPTLEQMRSTLATTTSLSSDQVGHQRLSSSPPRYTTGGPSSHIPITSSLCMTRQQAEQNQRATEGRKFKCKVCGKIFVEKGNLNKHVSSVHLKEKSKVCTEPGCDKSFSFRDGLMRHIAHVHRNQRVHLCVMCQKSFKQASHLSKHMRTIHKQIQ